MVTLLVVGGVVMAQKHRRRHKWMNPKAGAGIMTENMVKEYGLNESQEKQLMELNLTWMEKMYARSHGMMMGKGMRMDSMFTDSCYCKRNRYHGSRAKMTAEQHEQMHQEMKVAQEAYNAQLKNIFTPMQYEAYLKRQEELKEYGGRG